MGTAVDGPTTAVRIDASTSLSCAGSGSGPPGEVRRAFLLAEETFNKTHLSEIESRPTGISRPRAFAIRTTSPKITSTSIGRFCSISSIMLGLCVLFGSLWILAVFVMVVSTDDEGKPSGVSGYPRARPRTSDKFFTEPRSGVYIPSTRSSSRAALTVGMVCVLMRSAVDGCRYGV